MNEDRSLNILIVDDHKIYREGLMITLKKINGVNKIDEAVSTRNALNELGQNGYDLVLLDHYPPFKSGTICTREIKRLCPETKVICMSICTGKEHMLEMFENGADGYLLKNTDGVEIEIAIATVLRGRRYFSKDIASTIINEVHLECPRNSTDKRMKFNGREQEVLKLLYDELSSKQIAGKLCISERTVEFYRQSLLKKTGSKNIVGLIKYAALSFGVE